MSYDPGLPNDRDKVRHLIGDTDPDLEFLEDTEIQFHLDDEPSVRQAAASASRAIAARLAADTDYRFSTLWQNASDAYNHFMRLADALEKTATEDLTGIGFQSPVSGNSTAIGCPQFELGMHDYNQPDSTD